MKDFKIQLAIIIEITTESIGVELSETQLKMIVEDCIEVYKHESFEDLVLLFKKIRQGEFGPTYGKFNMIYIREAMAQHLEQKYSRMERDLHNDKTQDSTHKFKNRQEYIEAVNEGMKAQKKIHKMHGVVDLEEYNRFKIKYLQELKNKE